MSYHKAGTRKLADSTKKVYLSQKMKKHIAETGDFGVIGTVESMKRQKVYFDLGTLDAKSLSQMKDGKRAMEIIKKYELRQKKLLSGEYIDEKIDAAKKNLMEMLFQFEGEDNDLAKEVAIKLNELGRDDFTLLSSLWNKVKDYYPSMIENRYGKDKETLTREEDSVMERIIDTLALYNK